jgi:F-type H+-transporting ATPase subunit c
MVPLLAISSNPGLALFGATLSASLILIGASYGIGKVASAALEGTARQPEAGGTIRTSMIIPAALIEGVALFALVICLMAVIYGAQMETQELQTENGPHDVEVEAEADTGAPAE